jgi:hypothetical protein
MGNTLIGWANMVKTATLTASSADPALPVTNLAGDQGSSASGWQTLSGALTPLLTITPAVRTTVRAFGVFRTNLTASASVTFNARQSTTIVATTGPLAVNNGQVVGVLGSAIGADSITVSFSDPTNPDNHLNIPLVFAGPVWQPLTAMAWASSMGRDEVSDVVTTRGGQTYVDLRASYRRWEIALDGVRESEAFAQLDVLDRTSRAGSNVLLVPNQIGVNMQYEATFGILKATADVTFPLGVSSRRSWRGSLSERL